VLRVLDRSLSRLPAGVRTTVDWVTTIAFAVAFVLVFQAEVAKPYRVPTASMEPTLRCARPVAGCTGTFSDRVIVNRLAYHFRSPRRGEIVVFETPDAAAVSCPPGGTWVKRVIALPGETVTMSHGVVAIDGDRIDESSYIRSRAQAGVQSAVWHVPADKYFLMGDNRTGSCDSRTWGPVPRSNLIGPVIARYWPPQRLDLAP
jgi:signal peptidase I